MALPEIYGSAPDFPFLDETGAVRSLTEFHGAPVVIAFTPAEPARSQPTLQRITIENEQLPLITPADHRVAERYGVTDRVAVFVVGADGTLVWRYISDGGAPLPPASDQSGLSRREFIAAMLAASIAARFASNATAAITTAGPISGPNAI